MKTSPICYYQPDPKEHEATCARCGRYVKYTHIVINDDGEEIGMGICCVRKLRKTGEITGRLPRNGFYNWKMSDVREEAYMNWYCSSLSHAK